MWIGELSQRSGLPRDTIRYYEKLGLLAAAHRGGAGDYKVFGANSLQRIANVQRLKAVGFTLSEIGALLGAVDAAPHCASLPALLPGKIAALEAQIAALSAQRLALLDVQQACQGEACGAQAGLPLCVSAGAVKPAGRRAALVPPMAQQQGCCGKG